MSTDEYILIKDLPRHMVRVERKRKILAVTQTVSNKAKGFASTCMTCLKATNNMASKVKNSTFGQHLGRMAKHHNQTDKKKVQRLRLKI